MRARYYDPTTGRFISEDPVKDGLNWYIYCANDPVNAWDPSGTSFTVNKEDFNNYIKEDIQTIFGNENLEFEMTESKDNYTITGVSGEVGEEGSQMGSAVLSFLFSDEKEFEIGFANVPESGYSNGMITLQESLKGNDELRHSTIIHEGVHGYTDTMGYDARLGNSIGYQVLDSLSGLQHNEIVEKYKEATAITVEERFRAEMGYPSRSTVTKYMIGINDYGMWPTDSLTNPESKYYGRFKAILPSLTPMQMWFIDSDILRTTGGM